MSHQKEIAKYLKLISAKKLEKNHKECIELYNAVGGVYSEIGSYDEAAHYHEQALELCKTVGDRLGTAVAFRYIGEAKAALGSFQQAIEFTKKYLELAQKLNNKVETQRAWTTLGRVYLMQAQELKDNYPVIDKKTEETALEAEKKFQTALNLAESVRDQVDAKEYAQMTSGLLINLGIIKDIRGQHNEAVTKFNRAMETCRSAKLKEDLYRCQIILAGIYRQRNDVKMAVKTSEDALQTAKSIGKKLLICDALIERGLVRICQRDFKNAKRTFAQAYLEKSPSEEDHSKAIRLTKLAALVTSAYEKICKQATPSEGRLKLCDKLGDLFVAIGNYKLAAEYYRRAFTDAKVCSKPKSERARLLFSMAESFADDGQFAQALLCYDKELIYRDGNPSEQCQSLIKIAHMHEYLRHDAKEVSDAYERALDKADKDPKLMHNVLRYYVPYIKQKSFNPNRYRELDDLLNKLKAYPEVIEDIETEDYEESNELEDEIADIDDVITDDEDNDEVMMVGRRRAKGANKFKSNEVGDTPLHEASIKGDLKRVKSLVAQGHDINPRDNAGWIPLHEACNHGHYSVAEFLIEHGGDVNNRGFRGMSPLHDAASNGHFDIMRLLMKNGANCISLTDTGETVLSCLREYRSRNKSKMSNSELSEYKEMEAELLNVMDKCGYNLMNENVKNLNTRTGSARASASAHTTEPERPWQQRQQPELRHQQKGLREYRDAISTLKRKRPLDVTQSNKRASQPPTVATSFSTSISTKQWLLSDDIVEEEEDEDDVIPVDAGTPVKAASRKTIPDDDEDDVLLVKEMTTASERQGTSSYKSPDFSLSSLLSQSPQRNRSSPADLSPPLTGRSPDSFKSIHFNRSAVSTPFDLLSQPLTVCIEGRKLLIPIKDEYTTIADLKQSVIDRYSVLVNARPKISLAPVGDPECTLFENDLCRDVIRGSLVATVDSWLLDSIESTYLKECRLEQIEPLDFVKLEMRSLDEAEDKLNLAYLKFPRSHSKPIIQALARRLFSCASFQGSNLWFECQRVSQELLGSTLFTWTKLTRLNLKCAGLLRSHFELLCNSKSKLPELQHIDVSVNSIAYKSRADFISVVEKLRQVCAKLKRLDVRRNHLLFVKSLACGSLSTSETVAAVQGEGTTTTTTTTTTSTTTGNNSGHQGQTTGTLLDISEALDLCDIEILANDQYEYSLYLFDS